MPGLQQLSESQDSPEIPINENFAALAHAAVYGPKSAATFGLTWGYYGGQWGGFPVADGTLTLTDASTNYVVVAQATGVISVSTSNTNWNNTSNYSRVFKITTAGGVVTEVDDYRSGPGGIFGAIGGGGGSGGTELKGLTFTSDTGSTADSDPGNGKFKWNNATQASATTLFFDAQTADGISMSTLFAALGSNGFIYLQESDDATKWQKWKWTAVTAGSGYYKFTVTLEASSGSIASGVVVYCGFDATGSSTVGTVTSVNLIQPTKGITVTGGPITGSGSITLALADTLAALQALTGTGVVKRTGTDTFSVVSTISISSDTNGTLPVARGGTNLTGGTSGGLLIFSDAATIACTSAIPGNHLMVGGGSGAAPDTVSSLGTTTTVLHGNASGKPTFGAVDLTADVTGLLPIGNGGTGANTAGGARTALGLGTSAVIDIDTDATLAANSDSKIASQKAVVSYVASQLDGRSWKQKVRLASTGPGTLATDFANGSAMDGKTLATGDPFLLKDQTSGAENGIYVANASGAPTRRSDADTGGELVNATVEVSEGTVNADKQYTCSTDAPITVGTTSLVWVLSSTSGSTYTADETSLHLSGTTFSIKAGGVDLTTAVTGVLPVANYATGSASGHKFVRDDGSLQLVDMTHVTGVLPVANFATGSADGHKYVRDDGSLQQVDLAADVTGVLPVANFTTGTPDGTKFVRDDGVLVVPTVEPSADDNAQTGTSYSILAADRSKHVTFDNSSAIAVDVAEAGTTGFEDGFFTYLQNIGSGTVTLTPTTSTVNGQATLILDAGKSAILFSDGTNYKAITIGGGITNFADAVNTTAPNDTIPVYSLTPDSGSADVDMALVTLGNGALLRSIPDGTSTGGDKRGAKATDLQGERGGVEGAIASGDYSVIAGGAANVASAPHGGILAGTNGHTRNTDGAHAHGSLSMWEGTAQHRRVILSSLSSDDTPVILRANDLAPFEYNQIQLDDGYQYAFSALINAASSSSGSADSGVWRISGAIKRGVGAATTVMLGSPVVDVIVTPSGAMSVTATADNTNGRLVFTSTGLATETCQFCAVVDLNEIDLPV